MATVEFYQDESEAQEWRWRVKATNGQIIGASSEGFTRESYARNNLKSLPKFCLPADMKVASEDPENSKRPLSFYKDNADEWRWRITAGNGQITHAASEGYTSLQGAVSNVEALDAAVKEWDDAG
jgi:uncharacterized protein YegP (UPF0339 family)